MTIIDMKDKKYLGDVLDDLPQNCNFNKACCGAGGTDLALTNDNNYVVIVPTIDLVQNKISQKDRYSKVLGVYGDVSLDVIKNYLASGGNKILSTYHSLPKVIKGLGDRIKSFQLLVDESHMLVEGDDKDFMHDEINFIFNNFEIFKSVCFMTATPTLPETIPEQIKHFPIVTAKWSEEVITKVKLNVQQVHSRINDYVCFIAMQHMDNRLVGSPFFFYNSVEAITVICKRLIDSDVCSAKDIRIIAASKNNEYIKRYGHPELTIGNTIDCKDNPKPITFLTARAFEGCDIYQEDAVTYIIADGNKKHTRVEIHTKIPQIVNRVRNSKYKSVANLLYTSSFTRDCRSRGEFIQLITKEIEDIEYYLKEKYSKYSDIELKYVNTNLLDTSEFVTKDSFDNYIPNLNAGKRELNHWEAANQTYFVIKSDTHISNLEYDTQPLIDIINSSKKIDWIALPEGADKLKLGGKIANFKKLCLDYIMALEESDSNTIEFVEEYKPIFKDIRNILKNNKEEIITAIKSCAYRQQNLTNRRDMLVMYESDSLDKKVKQQFNVGSRYTTKYVKNVLQKIYDEYNLNKTSKSTDINKWFTVKNIVLNDRYICILGVN